jgi:serine/threonine-protein kinase
LDVRLLTEMGFFCIYGGQLQKGIDVLNRAYSLSPAGGNIGAAVSYALLLSLRLAEARKMAESLGNKEDAKQVLTMIAWSERNHDESNRRLADLKRVPDGTDAFTFAQIHTWRGERDAAFQYLDRAVRERNSSVLTIRVDPILRRLDGDYRYQALVKRLRLSE